jgi:Putative transposase
VSPDGERWIACRPGFFLPVRVLSRLFRRLFLDLLRQAYTEGKLAFFSTLTELKDVVAFARYLAPIARAEWVVYAKRPFGGAQQVLEYLGRYTHRVAISNNRLVGFTGEHVTFGWKDYRHESKNKVMQLDAHEFVRRFLLHVLPPGLQRIRHYGLLANRTRQVKLQRCRELLGGPTPMVNERADDAAEDYRDRYQRLTGVSLRDCPACAHGHMVCIETFLPQSLLRGPP